jgi:hypothetical protein
MHEDARTSSLLLTLQEAEIARKDHTSDPHRSSRVPPLKLVEHALTKWGHGKVLL